MTRLVPPRFWQHGGNPVLPALLWPASLLVARATASRVARPGWRASVPVICCGNAGVGGAGKTTLALDLVARLRDRGAKPHVLTRGHGGRAGGSLQVDLARHVAADVGDEALLLAGLAPCWVGADRAATARLAIAAGADVLVMDDGMQNPTLARDCTLLVIDGAVGFGNGRVLPAGPLREPPSAAAARAQAAILIGEDATGAAALLPASLPVLHGSLRPGPEIVRLLGRRVLAFAGIGRPNKFFAMLERSGVSLIASEPFPDHHAYRAAELAGLRARARHLDAVLVTTPKDFVRLSTMEQAGIVAVGVLLDWERVEHLMHIIGARE